MQPDQSIRQSQIARSYLFPTGELKKTVSFPSSPSEADHPQNPKEVRCIKLEQSEPDDKPPTTAEADWAGQGRAVSCHAMRPTPPLLAESGSRRRGRARKATRPHLLGTVSSRRSVLGGATNQPTNIHAKHYRSGFDPESVGNFASRTSLVQLPRRASVRSRQRRFKA